MGSTPTGSARCATVSFMLTTGADYIANLKKLKLEPVAVARVKSVKRKEHAYLVGHQVAHCDYSEVSPCWMSSAGDLWWP